MEDNTNSSPKKKRGRPPKEKATEANNTTNQKDNSHEFCSYSSNYLISDYYFGMNVFDIMTREELSGIVKDPIGNNELLRELSLMFYGTNGTFTNTVDYMTAMPTLDRVIVSHGTNKKKKAANKQKMISTLNMIKDKEIIRDTLFRDMVEGSSFSYFETTKMPGIGQKTMSDWDVNNIAEINEAGINASIISLPAKYTRIVGRKNSVPVIAFDLNYFDEANGENRDRKLRKYPKEIRAAYKNRLASSNNNYNWVVLDSNKTIVHKIRCKREEPWGRPLVLAAINDIMYNDYFMDTKRNVLDEMNNKIIYETFPEGKDKGTSALTQNQQQSQHDAVKSAILNKNNRGGTSFFSVASGTKLGSIDSSNTEIFDSKYESDLENKIATGLGIASSLLNGSGSGSYSAQTNNLELLSAQIFQWISEIESELNKCISANIICDQKNTVECKYLPTTYVNKKELADLTKELYLQGKGPLSLWVASCGISPDIFYALLDEEIELGIDEKYPVHITSYTATQKDNKGGRPPTDQSNNYSTLQTKASNSNNQPKPSTK